jgi:predicted nucleic acid-binding protein
VKYVIIDNAMLSAMLELQCTTLFQKVAEEFQWTFVIPNAVKNESMRRKSADYKTVIAKIKSIGIEKIGNTKKVQEIKTGFFRLHDGEVEALHLALEYNDSSLDYLLILDDCAARDVAKKLSLKVHGTIWFLCEAFKAKIVDVSELKHYLSGLRQIGFWYDPKIVDELLAY